MPERIPQSVTIRVPLQAFLSSDHITPATGKTIPVTISKNGAAYANPSGGATNAVEIGLGSYYVDLTTTDTGTLGPLFVSGVLTGIDNIVTIYDVVKATNGGLSALPDTAATTNASLLTSGTGTDQLSVASGRIDIGKALGTAVTLDANNVLNVSAKYIGGTLQTARDIGASVLLSPGTGTGQISLSSGAVTVGTNNDKSGYSIGSGGIVSTSFASGAITTAAHAAGSLTGALLGSDFMTVAAADAITEAYSTPGGGLTLAKFMYGLYQYSYELSISGATYTLKKRDQTTVAKTLTLNDATNPTAATEAS